ncbi:MAG: DUF4990 domain-containing protein [Paludibacteraceae bacterium]|nr:DUF4990 domain-containing protein [Paludibacteraceae bacterium]
MKKILSLLVITLASCCIYAGTYYASPTGSGDGNSYSSPCSFTNGLKKLKNAGDTLYLLGGQYDLGNTAVQNLNGTAQKRIVISGYPGETAILDFRTTPYGTRGLQVKSTTTYLHIKNLTLRYSGKNNLHNEGSYNFFENLDIYGSADTGCQMKNGGNNIIKNVDSHDNFDYQTMSGNTANFGGNADGFADKQFTGDGNHYIGCRAWNNSDDGWDFFQRVSNSNTIIEDCICYMNGAPYYDMSQHGRYQTDKAWFDSKVGTQMTDRYGNTITITLKQYPNQGNGNGFKMGGGYTDHKIEIHHSLAVGNYERGFDQNNNGGTMWVYNNTGYANKYNYGFTTAYGTNYLRNNISLSSKNADAYQSKTVGANDHNSWNTTGISCTAADFLSLDTTQILGARQSDGSLPEITLLHLVSGSELIDAGVDLGYTYTGNAPDLGCYETDGVQHPSVTCTSANSEQWVMAGDSIEPIVFKWGGSATRLTCSAKPEGITHKISNNGKTLTLSGTPTTAGVYTITITTVSDDNESALLDAVLHVKAAGLRRVAYVTTPGAGEDKALLEWLNTSDSINVTTLDAAIADNDYSNYDVIVLGPKPNSSAAAYSGLKGYDKPMLCLKPFIFKNSVWNWGTAVNTQDLGVTVSAPSHLIFSNLTIDGSTLSLFSSCQTNAVTAISQWTESTGITTLASPVSQDSYSSIAEMGIGSTLNGTTLTAPLLMIGISEYSTANLTTNGKRLVENAIYYLLGLPMPEHQGLGTDTTSMTRDNRAGRAEKILYNGQIVIKRGEQTFTLLGQQIK